MSTRLDALLPCPFCAQAAQHRPWHGGAPTKVLVYCPGIHPDDDVEPCAVAPSVTGETPDEAAELWNTRHPDFVSLLEVVLPDLEAHVGLLPPGARKRQATNRLAVARAALAAGRGDGNPS